MMFECDCGARYHSHDALMACQKANHGNPQPVPEAKSVTIGDGGDGTIELYLLDGQENAIATVKIRPSDVPEIIAAIVSMAGHDHLGRDFAVTLRRKANEQSH